MDLKSYSRWYDYSRARDEMFAATDLEFAPWYVARSDDKNRARLNIITHLLRKIPYESTKPEKSSCRSARSAAATESQSIHSDTFRRSSEPELQRAASSCSKPGRDPIMGAPDCGSRVSAACTNHRRAWRVYGEYMRRKASEQEQP